MDFTTFSDEELAHLLKEGDKWALSELVTRYQDKIFPVYFATSRQS